VRTTQVLAKRRRVFGSNFLANQAPTFGNVAGRAGQFEVIDVDDQKQTEAIVEVTRAPCGNFGEPDLREVIMAMLFPVSPGVRMAVEGQDQGAHRVLIPFPG